MKYIDTLIGCPIMASEERKEGKEEERVFENQTKRENRGSSGRERGAKGVIYIVHTIHIHIPIPTEHQETAELQFLQLPQSIVPAVKKIRNWEKLIPISPTKNI